MLPNFANSLAETYPQRITQPTTSRFIRSYVHTVPYKNWQH